MKVARGASHGALDKPDARIRFYLFHGADEAGSRALARRLLAGLGGEKHPIAAASIKSDPALLADEAGAISMFGGKRLLWIEPAADEICTGVEALLQAPAVEHPAVAITGVLRKTSALLKLADSHPLALSQVSYVPAGNDVGRMVVELGRAEGLRIAPQLAASVGTACGYDRAVLQQELAKFALYLNASPDTPQTLDQKVLQDLGVENAESDSGTLVDAALTGDLARLSAELDQLESSGIEPIPVVRAAQRRLMSLIPLRTRIDGGQSLDAVMASVFWKDQALIGQILSRWSSARLAHAMDRIARLERQLLSSAVDGRAALGEELLQISRAAAR